MAFDSLSHEMSVGIVGCGAMGASIAAGLIDAEVASASQVLVCDHNASKLDALAQACGAKTYASADDVFSHNPSIVILAIKPQVLGAFLVKYEKELAGKLVISIAAGVSLETLEGKLSDSRVIRVMPNLPVAVRFGASALCAGSKATDDDIELARMLFGALGCAFVMREDQLDAEGAVVGCGPAYFALMVDALTRAGIRAGLPAVAAREMVNTTMLGVAKMIADSGDHPRAYMERVTSPGGTTAAALYELEPLLVEGAYAAVDAALERTAELAKG